MPVFALLRIGALRIDQRGGPAGFGHGIALHADAQIRERLKDPVIDRRPGGQQHALHGAHACRFKVRLTDQCGEGGVEAQKGGDLLALDQAQGFGRVVRLHEPARCFAQGGHHHPGTDAAHMKRGPGHQHAIVVGEVQAPAIFPGTAQQTEVMQYGGLGTTGAARGIDHAAGRAWRGLSDALAYPGLGGCSGCMVQHGFARHPSLWWQHTVPEDHAQAYLGQLGRCIRRAVQAHRRGQRLDETRRERPAHEAGR